MRPDTIACVGSGGLAILLNIMRPMRLLTLFLGVFLISSPGANGQTVADQKDRQEWVQLFNGRDLEGWAVKIRGYDLDDNFGNTFRVVDGLLRVAYDAYEKFDNRFRSPLLQTAVSPLHYSGRVPLCR